MPETAKKNIPDIFAAIDFEIAGKYGPSACALGISKFKDGKIIDEFYCLIKPPSPKILFSNIHGLKWKDLKDAPSFPEIWVEAFNFLKDVPYLAAHNAPFDRNVLYSCCDYYDQVFPSQTFLCTLKGARKALKIDAYNLATVSAYFGFELDHHNAASDARNCGRILCKLFKMGLEPKDMISPQRSYSKTIAAKS